MREIEFYNFLDSLLCEKKSFKEKKEELEKIEEYIGVLNMFDGAFLDFQKRIYSHFWYNTPEERKEIFKQIANERLINRYVEMLRHKYAVMAQK